MSRPRVPNDNPFSESAFKTVKSQPDYPGRFCDVVAARRWFQHFFAWYADHHRHSGLAVFTPADVYFGRIPKLVAIRQQALEVAYNAHPQRFIHGPPKVKLPPTKVCINPLDPGDSIPMGSNDEDPVQDRISIAEHRAGESFLQPKEHLEPSTSPP